MPEPRPNAGRREQLPSVAPGDTDRQGGLAVDPRHPASCRGRTARSSAAWKRLVRPVRTAAALALFASSGHAAEPVPATAGAAGPPSPLAADAADRDLDEVPDRRDNCPNVANAPSPGAGQPLVCGAGFREAIDRFVFLDSRTFLPREGVDPALDLTGGGTRHVLLHVRPDDSPAVLSPGQRDRLQAAGVRLWDYLPSHTYYATVPATQAGMAAVTALPFVQGVSALEPRDRIARSVRRTRGAPADRQPDGSLQYSVEFFPDVSPLEIEGLLRTLGVRQVVEDEEERILEVRSFEDVLALARSDLVLSINDGPEALRAWDDLASAETSADTVDRVHGFEGEGLKVAMLELLALPLPPAQRPDMANRVVRDSTGVLGDIPEGFEHALEVAGIMVGDGTLDPTKRGFLPESTLINYTDVFPKTARHRGFGYPRQARDHHGAVVFNYSVGLTNCNKVGEYHSLGKQIDRSVALTGISIVSAAGNTRGPDGDFAGPDARHGPCQANLESLPHPIAKNDISVGNWDLATDDLSTTSSAGPAADERLKPDLVAPGNGVNSTTFNLTLPPSGTPPTTPFKYTTFSGTSAASSVVAGIAAQIYQALRDGTSSRDPLTVPPATVKAILVHTARDVDAWGPDYFTGAGARSTRPRPCGWP